jgi:hypothetical protein
MLLQGRFSPVLGPDPIGERQVANLFADTGRRLRGAQGTTYAPMVSASNGTLSRRLTRPLQIFRANSRSNAGNLPDVASQNVTNLAPLSDTMTAMARITKPR